MSVASVLRMSYMYRFVIVGVTMKALLVLIVITIVLTYLIVAGKGLHIYLHNNYNTRPHLIREKTS